ncbi:SpoIIE family protein phosphatase [Streptomyces misionensis]|uniref:SpoIIE family protein phosphatase n=1 Tax=Streptomyces misionensis TaxID=67331 RepID=UPI00381116F7
MGTSAPPGAPSQRLPPEAESAALARRFVRSALRDVVPELRDTAELLVDELVTNAVVHARAEVEVRVWAAEGRVYARIGDSRPERGLVPHDRHPYACTGRGLALVEELATSYGVHSGEDRKTVWFELWPDPPAPPTSAWETVGPRGRTVTVALDDVPYALYWAAQQQWEGTLRELVLAPSAADRAGIRPKELLAARETSQVLSACMTAAVQQEAPDTTTLSLAVAFPADAAAAAAALGQVLDRADMAARRGDLLTLPALPQIRAFRRWLLAQIVGQLSGRHPTAWTLVRGAPGAIPAKLAPWDASEVEAANVPTVAADDGNRIIAVNNSAANLLGWSAHDLVGRRLTVLIPEHLRERHVAGFSALLLTGESRILGRSIPMPALHHDGHAVPVRLAVQTQEAIDGRSVFVAQLTTTTAGPAPPYAPPGSRYATRAAPGPVHLPTGTKKARRVTVDRAVSEWLPLFADASAALNSTPDLGERMRRVCHVLTQWLADWCAVDLLDHGEVERACIVHRDPHLVIPGGHLGRLPPITDTTKAPLPRVLRGAGPLLMTEIPAPGRTNNPLDARQLELVGELGGSTAVIAPLRGDQEVFGALTLVRTDDEAPFTKDDIPLVAELVRGIAVGLDNARQHQNTHANAEHLQRALLPELPRARHLELVARYVPSSTTAKIGGDWYDAFALPGGDTVLVIGDVSGHDLQAAVAMSTLRNMLRGLAVDRPEPPGDVLHRLDLASHTLSPRSTATCVYALLKDAGGTGHPDLHHSSAGHLPPLLVTPEGGAHYLESGRGLLIGMDPDIPRPSACDPLPPRSTLLLFTDGLVERRGQSLGIGLELLREYAATLARDSLDVFCDELIIKFGGDATDDIALLALRPSGRPGEGPATRVRR